MQWYAKGIIQNNRTPWKWLRPKNHAPSATLGLASEARPGFTEDNAVRPARPQAQTGQSQQEARLTWSARSAQREADGVSYSSLSS